MSLVRRFARPVLASSFIISGVERLRDPDSTAHIAKALELASATIPQLALVKGQERLVGQAIAAKQVLRLVFLPWVSFRVYLLRSW